VNIAEEAEAEELLLYKELFTTEQGLVVATTSCFHVCCSCQSGQIFMPKPVK